MKICICGAQNTGKTTFIKDIIKAFPEFRTPTYTYRDAIAEHDLGSKINRNTTLESQEVILTAIHKEVYHPDNQWGDIIHDRSPMDAIAYSKWPNKYKKNETDITNGALRRMKQIADLDMEEFDLIIYIPVDESIQIENDNFRDIDPAYRRQMDKIFYRLFSHTFGSKIFNKWGYKVTTITGDRNERLEQFAEIYEALKGTNG